MRILIIGGGGMLGHQLLLHLRSDYEVKVTLRKDIYAYDSLGLFSSSNAYGGVEANATDKLLEIFGEFRPNVVINAVGIVKQLPSAKESLPSLEINSVFPHRLSLMARTIGARLLHFSTDCVFSGAKGNYSEADPPDPADLYGRTKLLGELTDKHCLTLRTSLIGHELERKTSLVEWFLSQKESVRGFRQAVFSGFSTLEMARIIKMLISKHVDAYGVWHVSSEPIDKYRLLGLIKKHYAFKIELIPDDEFRCERSLDSSRFRECFDYHPPSWDCMISEMSKTRSSQR